MSLTEYIRIEREIPRPLGEVWAIVASFGAIRPWIEGIERCSLEGHGVGAIRTVLREGATVREELVALDPDAHAITYRLLDPSPLPATGVIAQLKLTASGDGATHASWHASAETFAIPIEQVSAYIGEFYNRSLDALERLLTAEPVS